MYILYLDESGIDKEASYFVLAGLAVFEREIYWYAQDLDALQKRYLPDVDSPIEFHASSLRIRDANLVPEPFGILAFDKRKQLLKDIYQIIRNRRGTLFGVAIEKAWCANYDPYERAFEDLTSRFDLFLGRMNLSGAEPEQRGLIAVAESSYRRNLETLGERFRGGGTRWGQVHNLADVPFFLPARNTRMLQLADCCANAIFGRYNSGLTTDFDTIATKFDRSQGRIHGLAHLTKNYDCQCMACLSRQTQML
jgi:hypothetical protein